MLPEFKAKTHKFMLDNAIDQATLLLLHDQDQKGALSLPEFEQLVLAHNSTYQHLKNEIAQLYHQYPVMDLAALKELTRCDPTSFEYALYQEADFKDPNFPPNLDSQGHFKNKKVYPWKSLKDRYPDFTLFPKGKAVLPRQGKLGNCYLISPLSALYYNYPGAIEALFLDHRPHATLMKLCQDGQWVEVWVDHYFPFGLKLNIPAFGKYLEGAVWAMLLEKAWAKLYGSYKATIGGVNLTSFQTLTGAPTDRVYTLFDGFERVLREWCEKGYPLCANSRGRASLNQIDREEEAEDVNSAGLSGNHAYAILKVVRGTGKNGKEMTIIKVRNPWGFKKWKGDQAGDEDVEQALSKVDTSTSVQESDKGTFHIDLEHFIKYFGSVDACMYHPDYEYTSTLVVCPKNEVSFHEVEIEQEGSYYFLLTQVSPRTFRGGEVKYSLSPSQLGILDEKGEVMRRNKRDINKVLWINVVLKRQKYVIYSSADWKTFNPYEYRLSCYGERKVTFRSVGANLLDVGKLSKVKERVHREKQLRQSKQEKQLRERKQAAEDERRRRDEARFNAENNCAVQ